MFDLLLVESKLNSVKLNTKKASRNFNDTVVHAEYNYAVLCDQDVQIPFCIVSHLFVLFQYLL